MLLSRGYGDFFVHGGQGQHEVGGRRIAGADLDRLGRFAENAVEMGDEVVAARRHAVECIGAVVAAQRAAPELDDQHDGPVQRAAGFFHRHRTAQTAVRLRRGRDGRQNRQGGDGREKTHVPHVPLS